MTTILSIDPGERSGLTIAEYSEDEPLEIFYQDEVQDGLQGMIDYLTFNLGLVDEVVIENFIPREGRHGLNYTPLEVIGAVEMWAFSRHIPLTRQNPAGRLKAVPDHVLEKFGHWSGNKDRNIKESSRHAVWFVKNQGHLPTIKFGWGDGDF